MFPPRSRGHFSSSFGLLLLLFLIPLSARGDSLEDAARNLARKAAGYLRAVSVDCEERNLSSLQESTFLSFTTAFREELQRRGVNVVKREESARISLTLSEDLAGNIGIVSIRNGENSEVFMESISGRTQPGSDQSAATMGLHKELMLSQEEPLVDADVYHYLPKYLDTLGPQHVAIYEWKETKWELDSSKPLPRKRTASRDLLGHVGSSVDAMAALYAGEACRTRPHQSWNCEPFAGKLVTSSVDWELLENKKPPPWLSAAQFVMGGHDAVVITGADGLARIYSQGQEPIATIPGWGSEIASTHSGCGTGWQVLVTGTRDWSSPDIVTGIEIDGDKLTKVTEPTDFPGPVITLHQTTSDKDPDHDMAIAVVRNLHTGLYEVYRLTISCPN